MTSETKIISARGECVTYGGVTRDDANTTFKRPTSSSIEYCANISADICTFRNVRIVRHMPRRPNRTAGSCLRANVANEVDEIVIDKPTLSPVRAREERKMENRRHAKHTFRFDVDNGQPPDVPFFPPLIVDTRRVDCARR
jgi:hypothetical protein